MFPIVSNEVVYWYFWGFMSSIFEPFYTVHQAAEYLKLHPKTVLRFIHEGRLQGTKIGKSYRIQRSSLEAFAGTGQALKPQIQSRVTCVVELSDVSPEVSHRLTVNVHAMLLSQDHSPERIQLNSAYDAERQHLKLIIIGCAADTSDLLRSLDRQLEALR